MKTTYYTIFIITILFTTSCNRVKTTENIKTIDSLEQILDTISANQKQNNLIYAKLAYDTLKSDLDSLVKYMTILPVNKKHKKYFTLYSDLRRNFKNLFKIEVSKELHYSKKQISSLKKDINTNAITKEQFNKYITTEKTAISLLNKKNNKQLSESKQSLNKFNKYRPIILKIIDSTKAVYNK